jgi:hypothetical protein
MKTTIEWVHHSFQWMKSTTEWVRTILRKLVGWRPQLSGRTWFCNGWDLLDLKSKTEWVYTIHRKPFGWRPMNPIEWVQHGFPMDETHWMKNPKWVTKTLNHKTGNIYDSAIFQRMRDNKNSARLVLLLYQNYESNAIRKGRERQQNTIY